MTIAAKIDGLVESFRQFDSWQDSYKEIIKRGKNAGGVPQEQQIEKYKVKGCQSQVWLVPAYKNGVVTFLGDSDAVLVKGIITVLLDVYSGNTPDEILSVSPQFLKEIGITEHLSMNRSNGLASMVKQIQLYAYVYKSLWDKGVKSETSTATSQK